MKIIEAITRKIFAFSLLLLITFTFIPTNLFPQNTRFYDSYEDIGSSNNSDYDFSDYYENDTSIQYPDYSNYDSGYYSDYLGYDNNLLGYDISSFDSYNSGFYNDFSGYDTSIGLINLYGAGNTYVPNLVPNTPVDPLYYQKQQAVSKLQEYYNNPTAFYSAMGSLEIVKYFGKETTELIQKVFKYATESGVSGHEVFIAYYDTFYGKDKYEPGDLKNPVDVFYGKINDLMKHYKAGEASFMNVMEAFTELAYYPVVQFLPDSFREQAGLSDNDYSNNIRVLENLGDAFIFELEATVNCFGNKACLGSAALSFIDTPRDMIEKTGYAMIDLLDKSQDLMHVVLKNADVILHLGVTGMTGSYLYPDSQKAITQLRNEIVKNQDLLYALLYDAAVIAANVAMTYAGSAPISMAQGTSKNMVVNALLNFSQLNPMDRFDDTLMSIAMKQSTAIVKQGVESELNAAARRLDNLLEANMDRVILLKEGVREVDQKAIRELVEDAFNGYDEKLKKNLSDNWINTKTDEIIKDCQQQIDLKLGKIDPDVKINMQELYSADGNLAKIERYAQEYKINYQYNNGTDRITTEFQDIRKELMVNELNMQSYRFVNEINLSKNQYYYINNVIRGDVKILDDLDKLIYSGNITKNELEFFQERLKTSFLSKDFQNFINEIQPLHSTYWDECLAGSKTILSDLDLQYYDLLKPEEMLKLRIKLDRIRKSLNTMENRFYSKFMNEYNQWDVLPSINGESHVVDGIKLSQFMELKEEFEKKVIAGTVTDQDYLLLNDRLSELGFSANFKNYNDAELLFRERNRVMNKLREKYASDPEYLANAEIKLDLDFQLQSGFKKITMNGETRWVRETIRVDKTGIIKDSNGFLQEIIFPNGTYYSTVSLKPMTVEGYFEYIRYFPKAQVSKENFKIVIRDMTIGSLPDNATKEAKEVAEKLYQQYMDMLDGDLAMQATILDKISQYHNIAMLVNFKTGVKNFIENIQFGIMQNISRVNAAMADKIYSKFSGERTVTLPTKYKLTADMDDADKLIYALMREDLPEVISKYGLEKGVLNSYLGKKAEFLLDLAVNDRMFFRDAWLREFDNQIKLMWKNKYSKMDGLIENVFYNNPFKYLELKDKKIVYNYCLEWAEETILSNPTMASRFFTNLKGFLNGLSPVKGLMGDGFFQNKFIRDFNGRWMVQNNRGFGLGDFTFKYTKIPANQLVQMAQYAPTGIVNTFIDLGRCWKGIIKPEELQRRVVLQLGKMVSGSALFYSGWILMNKGILTGEYDFTEAVAKQSFGVKNMNINMSKLMRWVASGFDDSVLFDKNGDTFVTVDLGMFNLIKAGGISSEYSEQQQGGIILAMVLGLGKMAWNESLLKNFEWNPLVSNFIKVNKIAGYLDFNGGDIVLLTLSQAAGDALSTFIPTLLKQARDFMDPYYRKTSDSNPWQAFLNKLYNRLPYASEKLEKITVDGKDFIKYPEDMHNWFNVFINPFWISHFSADGITIELFRLYDQNKDSSLSYNPFKELKVPMFFENENNLDEDGKPQKIFIPEYLRENKQEEMAFLYHEKLRAVFNTPEYKNASLPDQIKQVEMVLDQVKREVMEKVATELQQDSYNQWVEKEAKIATIMNSNLSDDEKNRQIQQVLIEDKYIQNIIKGTAVKDPYIYQTDFAEELQKLNEKDMDQWTDEDRENAGRYLKGAELVKYMEEKAASMVSYDNLKKDREFEKKVNADIKAAREVISTQIQEIQKELEELKKPPYTEAKYERQQQLQEQLKSLYSQIKDVNLVYGQENGIPEKIDQWVNQELAIFDNPEQKRAQLNQAIGGVNDTIAGLESKKQYLKDQFGLTDDYYVEAASIDAQIERLKETRDKLIAQRETITEKIGSGYMYTQIVNPDPTPAYIITPNNNKWVINFAPVERYHGADKYLKAVDRDLKELASANPDELNCWDQLKKGKVQACKANDGKWYTMKDGEITRLMDNYQQRIDFMDRKYVYELPELNEYGLPKYIASINPYYNYVQLMNFFSKANESIDIALFEFRDDQVGLNHDIYACLRDLKRLKPHVRIRVVTSKKVISSATYDPATDSFVQLRDEGYLDDYAAVNPSDLMHNKFFIIDNKIVAQGSMNLTSGSISLEREVSGTPYYAGHLNNMIFITQPELARTYKEVLEHMMVDYKTMPTVPHDWKKKMDQGASYSLGTITMKPYFTPYKDWYQEMHYYIPEANESYTYQSAMNKIIPYIRNAKEKIRIFAFSFADKVMISELMKVNVPVEIYIDGGQYASLQSVQPPVAVTMIRMLASRKNVTIKKHGTLSGQPEKSLHMKTIIIDDRIVLNGSFNFSKAAADDNNENLLVVDHPETAKLFKKLIDDFALTRTGSGIRINYPFANSAPHMFYDLVKKEIKDDGVVEVSEGAVSQTELEAIRSDKTPPELDYVVVEKDYFNSHYDQSMGYPYMAKQNEIMRELKYDDVKNIVISYKKKNAGILTNWNTKREVYTKENKESAIGTYFDLYKKVTGKNFSEMFYDYFNKLAITNNTPEDSISHDDAILVGYNYMNSLINSMKGTEVNFSKSAYEFDKQKNALKAKGKLIGLKGVTYLATGLLKDLGLPFVLDIDMNFLSKSQDDLEAFNLNLSATMYYDTLFSGYSTTSGMPGNNPYYTYGAAILFMGAAFIFGSDFYTQSDLYKDLKISTTIMTKEELLKQYENEYRQQTSIYQTYMIQSHYLIDDEKERLIKLQQDGMSGEDQYYTGDIYKLASVERYANGKIKRAKRGNLTYAVNSLILEDLYSSNGFNKADYRPLGESFSNTDDLNKVKKDFEKASIDFDKVYIRKNFSIQDYEIKFTKIVDGKICNQDKFDPKTCTLLQTNWSEEYNTAVFSKLLVQVKYMKDGVLSVYFDVDTDKNLSFNVTEPPVISQPDNISTQERSGDYLVNIPPYIKDIGNSLVEEVYSTLCNGKSGYSLTWKWSGVDDGTGNLPELNNQRYDYMYANATKASVRGVGSTSATETPGAMTNISPLKIWMDISNNPVNIISNNPVISSGTKSYNCSHGYIKKETFKSWKFSSSYFVSRFQEAILQNRFKQNVFSNLESQIIYNDLIQFGFSYDSNNKIFIPFSIEPDKKIKANLNIFQPDLNFIFKSIYDDIKTGTWGAVAKDFNNNPITPDWLSKFKKNDPWKIGASELYILFKGGELNSLYPTKVFYDPITNISESRQDFYNYLQAFIKNSTAEVYASFSGKFFHKSIIDALKTKPTAKVFWAPTGFENQDTMIRDLGGVKKSDFQTNLILSDNVLILIQDDGLPNSLGMVVIIKNPNADIMSAVAPAFQQTTENF